MDMMKKNESKLGEEITNANEIVRVFESSAGWSLFYGTVGDYDPGNIDCTCLRIVRGVPTNTQSSERKYQITDIPVIHSGSKEGRKIAHTFADDGPTFLPRSLYKVHTGTEYYTIKTDKFWLAIQFSTEDLSQSHLHLFGKSPRHSVYGSYARFRRALWQTIKIVPCAHPDDADKPLPLDLGVKTLPMYNKYGNSGTETDGVFQPRPDTRILIVLVSGNTRARWLAVYSGECQYRITLLRCEGCCAACAVAMAGGMKGNWLVIL